MGYSSSQYKKGGSRMRFGYKKRGTPFKGSYRRRAGASKSKMTSSRDVQELKKQVASLSKQVLAPSQRVFARVLFGGGTSRMSIMRTLELGENNCVHLLPVTAMVPTIQQTLMTMKNGLQAEPGRLAKEFTISSVVWECDLSGQETLEVMPLLFPVKSSLDLNLSPVDYAGEATVSARSLDDKSTVLLHVDGPFSVEEKVVADKNGKAKLKYDWESADSTVFKARLAKGAGKPLSGWQIYMDGKLQTKKGTRLQRPQFLVKPNVSSSRTVSVKLVWTGEHKVRTGAYSEKPVFDNPLALLVAVRGTAYVSAEAGDAQMKIEDGAFGARSDSAGTIYNCVLKVHYRHS